jgi:hypothetical protein
MTKTKKPIITIHNATTNEIIEREMTDAEFSSYQEDAIKEAANKAEADAKETAKAAILNRIGLTADELKTILG